MISLITAILSSKSKSSIQLMTISLFLLIRTRSAPFIKSLEFFPSLNKRVISLRLVFNPIIPTKLKSNLMFVPIFQILNVSDGKSFEIPGIYREERSHFTSKQQSGISLSCSKMICLLLLHLLSLFSCFPWKSIEQSRVCPLQRAISLKLHPSLSFA